jgi:hypothetical protein
MQPADFSILFFLIERVGPGIVDPGDLAGHGDTADKCSRPRRNWRLPLDFQIDRIVGTVKDRVPEIPSSLRKIWACSARHSRAAVSTTLCRMGCSWNLERLIAPSICDVAVCRSNASFSSRVSSATFLLRPAERRTACGALRRFRVAALRRRDFTGSPLVLRRLIGSPLAQDVAS